MRQRPSRPALLLAVLLAACPAATLGQERGPFEDALAREQYGRHRTVDVLHYRLDLAFDPERREAGGIASIRLTPINDGLAVVELDAGPMEIGSVRLEGEETATGLSFRHDGKRLRVELPRAYRAGEELTLNVSYSVREPAAGLYFVGPDEGYPDKPRQVWSQGEAEDNHFWFPAFDHPGDRATSEEVYTVPAGWTAVGNGELVEVAEDPVSGTRSFHYRMDVPHVSYLISVAAGRFEKYTDDFDGTPVEYYVPEGTGQEKALRSLGPTPDILAFFSDRTGVRYPYAKYAQSQVFDFIYGGMENISATTNTAETLHDEVAALETDSWGLVAHEAAHQWFGDLLTCASWSHAWLNEGFATYWENLWREHAQGRDEFLYRMMEDRDAYLSEDRESYRRAIVTHTYTDPFDLFDSHLYPKGGWVLHMMRGILGDERFFKTMQHYTRTYRERVVETADLRRAVFDATGVDLGRFFEQWTRRGGHPEVRVTRQWDPEASVLTLHLEQTQEVDDLTPLFWVPLRIAVDTAEGSVEQTVTLERRFHDVTLALPSDPLLVRVDPDFHVLMELDQERDAAEMLRGLQHDPNPAGRILAARDLAAKAAAREATPGLARSLANDPFHGVRIEAAAALGKVRGEEARTALVDALEDADARVRAAAARALGSFRDDATAAEALDRALATDEAYGPRAAAVLSLAKIRAAGAGERARAALAVESYREQIRAAALEALAALAEDGAFGTLREWAAYGRPPRARLAAIAALGQLAEKRGAGPERDEIVLALIDLLDDPYIFARQEAISVLGELRAAAAVERLERSAAAEPDSRLRRAARLALRRIRSADAAEGVEELGAEVERLREEVRRQTERIEELEKQRP